MDAQQQQILTRRLRFIRRWPAIAGLVALLTLGFYGWVFIKQPLLVNPQSVIQLVQMPSPDSATLTLLAVIAPILFLTVGGLILLLLLFVTLGLINEGRLIRQILAQTEATTAKKI
ncbi:hypothetical protein [Halothiobacillus sp. DCM-1]|uniref:hypothetical protein n=1 Tax=Halothiobacillus sp. DCM-1 TaxID=3112558 RepID=UPI00325163BF